MDIYDTHQQEVIERISRHCPEALGAYFICVNHANKGRAYFSKSMVSIDMSQGWTRFRNNIKKLALENVLEWHPIDGGISITLADLDA